jgi:hypothetical protein
MLKQLNAMPIPAFFLMIVHRRQKILKSSGKTLVYTKMTIVYPNVQSFYGSKNSIKGGYYV